MKSTAGGEATEITRPPEPPDGTRVVVCSHMTLLSSVSVSGMAGTRRFSDVPDVPFPSCRQLRRSGRARGSRRTFRVPGSGRGSEIFRRSADPIGTSSIRCYAHSPCLTSRFCGLLTETGLRDEVPGHGEYVFLARLVVTHGFVHLQLAPVDGSRALIHHCHSTNARIATVRRCCAAPLIVRERGRDGTMQGREGDARDCRASRAFGS